MKRTPLRSHKGVLVTPDTFEAVGQLKKQASLKGFRVSVDSSENHAQSSPLSKAGREVLITFTREHTHPQERLNALWALAIPLGFTPLSRYPILKGPSEVFHFFGEWRSVYDRLMAEGRGHLALPALTAAALSDVGLWGGERSEVFFIQAQLHRLGRNPGALDGVIGPRTIGAIESLSLDKVPTPLLPSKLASMETHKQSKGPIEKGVVALNTSSRRLTVRGHGGVVVNQNTKGASFEVHSPCRIVVDIR